VNLRAGVGTASYLGDPDLIPGRPPDRFLPPCYLKTTELCRVPDRIWLEFHWSIAVWNLEHRNMRNLGISAIIVAACLATLSIVFIGLASSRDWSSSGAACSVAEGLCRRPSLLAIPVMVAMHGAFWCWRTSRRRGPSTGAPLECTFVLFLRNGFRRSA
jgi:hypothetical protein